MRLHCTQIATRPPQQLCATAVAKRVWMQLTHTDALPDRLHELPDAMICHPAFAPCAALCAIPDDEQRIVFFRVGSLVPDIIGQDLQRHLGQRYAAFIAAFAFDPREAEVTGKVTDIQANDLRSPKAAVGQERKNRPLPSIRGLLDDPLDRRPARDSRHSLLALRSGQKIEWVFVQPLTAYRPLAEAAERRQPQPNRARGEPAATKVVLVRAAQVCGEVADEHRSSDLVSCKRLEISKHHRYVPMLRGAASLSTRRN